VALALAFGSVARGQQAGLQGQAAQTAAQQPAITQPAQSNASSADDGESAIDGSRSIEEQQARMRNSDRQKQLVDDTQRLLSLANELKVDVDKTDKNTLSLDVIRKADEIEKLAHNVKEKMKGSD
jgi:hypothetical protein